MPSIRDVSVHVTDSEGTPLKEWGVQHLGNLGPRKKQAKVSAYIKSRTDMAFRIVVEAKIPYTDYVSDQANTPSTDVSDDIYSRTDLGGKLFSHNERRSY